MSDPSIEELKNTPPRIEMSTGQKILQAIGVACSIIAVAALTIAVYATNQAWNVSTCVNHVLGTRSAPAASDAEAHITLAGGLLTYAQAQAAWQHDLTLLLTGPKDQKPSPAQVSEFLRLSRAYDTASQTFVGAVNQYVKTLNADQDLRLANPLGRC